VVILVMIVFLALAWALPVRVLCKVIINVLRGSGRIPPDWLLIVTGLLKWPALIGLLVMPVAQFLAEGKVSPLVIALTIMGVIGWFIDRNDDDWKKKLKSKTEAVVRRFEGRLIVVPQGA
jgi:hypothetical protein